MGFDTAASAPEEGRKCWLKVSYDGTSRMVEWNTACCTFKDMDKKVRKMFMLKDKAKLLYSYKTSISGAPAEILMSSDEELGTALRRMDGEVLFVDLSLRQKEKIGILCRVLRTAKSLRPRVSQFVTSLPAAVVAHVQAVPYSAIAERLRASAHACCAARHNTNPNANAAPAHACRMRSPKVLMCFVLLLAAVMVARYKVKHLHESSPFNYYAHGFHGYNSHVTILAASYGGRDVTNQAQEFYNQHNHLQASNRVFGDPSFGHRKFLHVVYQRTGFNGMSEVYSQAFQESDGMVELSAKRDECQFPVEAIVNGKSIRVLGAMYDGVVTTCAARRLLSAGHFNTYTSYVQGKSYGIHKPTGHGAFTMAYLKNNKIQIVTAKEGQAIVL